MTLDSRTFEAATRVLATAARDPGAHLDVDGTYAAYLVGRGGGTVPAFHDPNEQRIHEMAAAFGARSDDAALRLLHEAATAEDNGEADTSALIHACFLGGDALADRIIDMVELHPGHQLTGQLLVRTTRPAALLALYGARTDGAAIPVVGELVLLHRDAGSPFAPAEAAWKVIEAAWPERSNVLPPDLLALQVRMSVRESVEAGVQRLVRGKASYQWDRLPSGVLAVIARLVRSDPDAAARLVSGTHEPGRPPREPREMALWVRALTWWFELPRAAEPIVEACIGAVGPERELELVAGLVGARSALWLDRAIAAAGPHPSADWARRLGAEAKRLREAGHEAGAELVRERMARVAPAELDLYDVRSAPELPRTTPWLHGADLP